MARVYAIPSVNHPTEYFGTRRQADRVWRDMANDGDEPEAIHVRDAACECNVLAQWSHERDKAAMDALYHLKELVAIAPADMLRTVEGGRAVGYPRTVDPEFLKDCGLL